MTRDDQLISLSVLLKRNTPSSLIRTDASYKQVRDKSGHACVKSAFIPKGGGKLKLTFVFWCFSRYPNPKYSAPQISNHPHRKIRVQKSIQHMCCRMNSRVGKRVGLNSSNLFPTRARESETGLLVRPSVQVLEIEQIVAVRDVLGIHTAMNNLHLGIYDFHKLDFQVVAPGVAYRFADVLASHPPLNPRLPAYVLRYSLAWLALLSLPNALM